MKNKKRFTIAMGVLLACLVVGFSTTVFSQVVSPPVEVVIDRNVTTNVQAEKPVGVVVTQGKIVNVDPVNAVITAPPHKMDGKQKAIKIFCKILDHELSDKLGGGYNSKSFFSEGCRGVWVPDTGVVINLNVNFPVHQEKVVVKPKEKKIEKDDLWEQFDAELSGKADPAVSQAQSFDRKIHVSTGNIDGNSEDRIETLKDIVLDVLAKYGHRCKEQIDIDNGKMIIIASGQGGPFHYSFSTNFTWKGDDNDPMSMYFDSQDEFGRQEEIVQKIQEELSSQQDHLAEILSLQERQLGIAKRSLDRALQQHKAGVVSQDEVDKAEKELTSQRIELEKARANLEKERDIIKDKRKEMRDELKNITKQLDRRKTILPGVPKPAPQPHIRMKIPNIGRDAYMPFNFQGNGVTTMVIQIPFDRLTESRNSKESIKDFVKVVSY